MLKKNQFLVAVKFAALFLLPMSLMAALAHAELVAVSQMGYHPNASKNVIAYTNMTGASFSIIQKATNISMATYPLQKAKDFNGNIVECQGNNPCIFGDFSDFRIEGTYFIQTSLGGKSPDFSISHDVYTNTSPILLEFFNAQLMQNSSYHGDMFSGYDPPFTVMADGSFLMEADQAASALIRLGSAYRRNPSLFSSDKHNISANGKPDMQEYILSYANYLKGLQGLDVQERKDGIGFRLGWSLAANNAFVPGPTNLTQLDIYIPGNPPRLFTTIPLKSLCGANDSSPSWNACIANAAQHYKCQLNEPCINITYVDSTGLVASHNNGFGVSKGWGPDFSCRLDINLNLTIFNNSYNPCMIFYPGHSRMYTTETLFAFLIALPALNDYDALLSQELFNRSMATYRYIKSSYPSFNTTTDETPYWGASMFLLYDYTGNSSYLQQAYSIREIVPQFFISDHLRGNEYYWHEYVRHKADMESFGLAYLIGGSDPKDFFRGKLFFDYKDSGPDKAISRTAERVFQFDPNIQFQNSRYMLDEAIIAARTTDIDKNAESFMQQIADAQLSWLTGMNGVQQGTSGSSPIGSMSFIFGIGNFPSEIHSSLLMKFYRASSNGTVQGIHSPIFEFYNGSDYVLLDGAYNFLGYKLGSFGNGYKNEPRAPLFTQGQVFRNGLNYIPGWITGAYDLTSDNDVIFNYGNNANNYEFTESTNELVATALELLSFLDGRYNNRTYHATLKFSNENSSIPKPLPNNPANSTNISILNNSCYSSVQNIPASCTGTISIDSYNGCRTILCRSGPSNLTILACDKPTSSNPTNFEMYKQSEFGMAQLEICIGQSCIKYNGFEKSMNYPICMNSTNITPIPPSNETPSNPPNETPVPNNSTPTNPNASCFSRVNDLPASCTTSITQDVKSGCRSITCGNGFDSISVMACDKPDSGIKQFFEMYKQSSFGAPPKICITNSCMQNEGYVKSQVYPICIGNSTTPSNSTPVNEPPPENIPSSNSTPANSTQSNSARSVVLSIAPWYPQGRSYVFKCTANGYIPTAYDWVFGDGDKQLASFNKDVYHTYSLPGKYAVQCNARDSLTDLMDLMNISVT